MSPHGPTVAASALVAAVVAIGAARMVSAPKPTATPVNHPPCEPADGWYATLPSATCPVVTDKTHGSAMLWCGMHTNGFAVRTLANQTMLAIDCSVLGGSDG